MRFLIVLLCLILCGYAQGGDKRCLSEINFSEALEAAGNIGDDARAVAGKAADILVLRKRALELSIEAAQKGKIQMAEGIGGARFEIATGRKIQRYDLDPSVDFVDPVYGKFDLKGPLRNTNTGEAIPITDKMLFGDKGLAKSIIKEANNSTASQAVVVDTLGLSSEQISNLKQIVSNSITTAKPIIYLE